MPTSRSRAAGYTWRDVPLAPIVLVRGAEPLLADRALERLEALAKEQGAALGGLEKTSIEAANYASGGLEVLASPSLFGEHRHIVITGVEATSQALIDDGVAYVGAAGHDVRDVTVVLRHDKGTRGKKLLDAVTKAGYPVVVCESIKSDRDKTAFVKAEFAAASRKIIPAAVQALVEALGSDLRELAAGASQLVADTTGTITVDIVNRYYGGRVEATGFRVADAAVAGETTQAITLLRHAIEVGVDPVPLVAVLAMKLRALARVSSSSGRNPAALGMAPWQIDRARKELRGWSQDGLAQAITAVADADAQVKGEGRDAEYAVERAVLRICELHGRR